MTWLPAVFAFLVMAAGWHYLFHSRFPERLAPIEAQAANRLRARLRRAGGLAMFLLGIAILAGFYSVDYEHPNVKFLVVWSAVVVLLLLVVVLGLLDLRLTWKLKGRSNRDKE